MTVWTCMIVLPMLVNAVPKSSPKPSPATDVNPNLHDPQWLEKQYTAVVAYGKKLGTDLIHLAAQGKDMARQPSNVWATVPVIILATLVPLAVAHRFLWQPWAKSRR